MAPNEHDIVGSINAGKILGCFQIFFQDMFVFLYSTAVIIRNVNWLTQTSIEYFNICRTTCRRSVEQASTYMRRRGKSLTGISPRIAPVQYFCHLLSIFPYKIPPPPPLLFLQWFARNGRLFWVEPTARCKGTNFIPCPGSIWRGLGADRKRKDAWLRGV
jgi:hypothetical protein